MQKYDLLIFELTNLRMMSTHFMDKKKREGLNANIS
jgi:hypothetical protein